MRLGGEIGDGGDVMWTRMYRVEMNGSEGELYKIWWILG